MRYGPRGSGITMKLNRECSLDRVVFVVQDVFFFSNRNDYSILADVMFSFLEYAIDTISCFFNANLTNPKYVKSFIRRFYSDDLLNIDLVYFPNDEINHSNGWQFLKTVESLIVAFAGTRDCSETASISARGCNKAFLSRFIDILSS